MDGSVDTIYWMAFDGWSSSQKGGRSREKHLANRLANAVFGQTRILSADHAQRMMEANESHSPSNRIQTALLVLFEWRKMKVPHNLGAFMKNCWMPVEVFDG